MSAVKQAHTILMDGVKPIKKAKKPVFLINECMLKGKNTDAKDCPPVNIEFQKENKGYGYEPTR